MIQYLQEIEDEANHEMVRQRYSGRDYSALIMALNCDKSVEVLLKLIDIGGEELVMMHSDYHGTSLHAAIGSENVSLDIISKLIEVGRHELLMMGDQFDRTALHCACENENPSIGIVSKLIEAGGRELVMKNNEFRGTALHYAACGDNGSMSQGIVLKLIEAGGRELVIMSKKYGGETALHFACGNRNMSQVIVLNLIEAGGKELLMTRDKDGKTALHYACGHGNVSLDIISKLIDVGGKEMVRMSDRYGKTALHFAVCRNGDVSLDIISKLIEVGGQELLTHKSQNGDIALHYGYFFFESFGRCDDSFVLLVKECILANVGGEFGIGGLFHVATKKVQNIIYKKWQKLLPALKLAIESLQEEHQPPLLHAVILARAPTHVICDIVNQFEYSLLKTDRIGRYPIEVAFQESLGWREGLKLIVEATVAAQRQKWCPSRILNSAAWYGLKWKNHMKELAEANVEEIMNGYDDLTGLHLFMIAAMGENNDLSAIYGVMRMSPERTSNMTCVGGCMGKRRLK